MATLTDIARIVGVSVSTVSRVLNDQPGLGISDEVRLQIFQTAEDLDYRLKAGKRPVGRQRIRRVGVIGWFNEQWDRNMPYYSLIRDSVERECHARGLTGPSFRFQWSDSIRSYSSFLEFDGVIVIGNNLAAAEYFRDKELRVVFVDASPDPHRYDSIVPDFVDGTQQALGRFAALGYASVGYLGGANEKDGTLPRFRTFRRHLENAGVYRPELVRLEGDWTASAGYAMAQACIAKGPLARAYFIANDPMAIGAMRAFSEAGIRIPEDVAIIGFDDMDMAAYVRPPLTTVRIPTRECGRLAVHLLVDGLGDLPVPLQITVPTALVIRESCGPAAARGD